MHDQTLWKSIGPDVRRPSLKRPPHVQGKRVVRAEHEQGRGADEHHAPNRRSGSKGRGADEVAQDPGQSVENHQEQGRIIVGEHASDGDRRQDHDQSTTDQQETWPVLIDPVGRIGGRIRGIECTTALRTGSRIESIQDIQACLAMHGANGNRGPTRRVSEHLGLAGGSEFNPRRRAAVRGRPRSPRRRR